MANTKRTKPLKPFPRTDCPECAYLREERAAIHELDGKMSRVDAERAALVELCNEHQPRIQQDELIKT